MADLIYQVTTRWIQSLLAAYNSSYNLSGVHCHTAFCGERRVFLNLNLLLFVPIPKEPTAYLRARLWYWAVDSRRLLRLLFPFAPSVFMRLATTNSLLYISTFQPQLLQQTGTFRLIQPANKYFNIVHLHG